MLKVSRAKSQFIFKGIRIKVTTDFSSITLNPRRNAYTVLEKRIST